MSINYNIYLKNNKILCFSCFDDYLSRFRKNIVLPLLEMLLSCHREKEMTLMADCDNQFGDEKPVKLLLGLQCLTRIVARFNHSCFSDIPTTFY